jgi:hypothetical protein
VETVPRETALGRAQDVTLSVLERGACQLRNKKRIVVLFIGVKDAGLVCKLGERPW